MLWPIFFLAPLASAQFLPQFRQKQQKYLLVEIKNRIGLPRSANRLGDSAKDDGPIELGEEENEAPNLWGRRVIYSWPEVIIKCALRVQSRKWWSIWACKKVTTQGSFYIVKHKKLPNFQNESSSWHEKFKGFQLALAKRRRSEMEWQWLEAKTFQAIANG